MVSKALQDITPEQRQAYLEQGRIARQEKISWAEIHLDMDWGEDEKEWKRLASLYGVKLPQKHTPNHQLKYVKRMMKAVGADVQEYAESCGCKNLLQLAKLNPRENARAFCGLFLEYWHELQTDPVEYEED